MAQPNPAVDALMLLWVYCGGEKQVKLADAMERDVPDWRREKPVDNPEAERAFNMVYAWDRARKVLRDAGRLD